MAYADALVDELARSGMRHAVVCPGSRSTPLAVALAEHPAVKVWVHLDERSAAFFGLGLAKALRLPVALLCTSGTAAANFYPAVVEARYGRVPLLVLTADRPPELRDIGAPQSIDQTRLYGEHAKWYCEVALPEATEPMMRYVRTVACRAYATALATPAGPVHLNMPFREPFLPERGEPRPGGFGARAGGEPYVRVEQGLRRPEPELIGRLARGLVGVERGLIVCGPQDDPELPEAVARLAERLGYPVLADPLSGLRAGPHDRRLVVEAYDAFLRDAAWVEANEAPEVVLRLGAMSTSKPLTQYLAHFPDARQILVDGGDPWRDATLLASDALHADAALFCRALRGELPTRLGLPTSWLREWLGANARSRAAMGERLVVMHELFEGRVFSELSALLPDGATLYVGNSMPVRDLDTFFSSTDKRIRVLCNRGANGIDGVVSSALGASAASEGLTVLVVGDLSFLHDLNGLLATELRRLDITVVLVNNDGGGIFSFLPQAGRTEHFEQLFGTPHGLDLATAVGLFGGGFVRAEGWGEFRAAVEEGMGNGGLSVVELRTDRERNVALHREVWAAVSGALRAGVGAPRVGAFD